MSRNRRLGVACRRRVTGSRVALGARSSCASVRHAIAVSGCAKCVGPSGDCSRYAVRALGTEVSSGRDACMLLDRRAIGKGSGPSLRLRM